jgi:hypothetical protein
MKTLAASPEGVMTAGKEYDIDDAAAQALIDGGYAELVSGELSGDGVESPKGEFVEGELLEEPLLKKKVKSK